MARRSMLPSLPLPQYDFPRAARALGALLSNPDDLPQVFTLIDALSGTAPHRLLFKFRRSPEGAALLHEKPDIARVLADREGLRALPEGSLGRTYLAFVESEGITPEGIRDASLEADAKSERRRPEMFKYLHQRMRDTHDLWHAVTGYKGDVAGELSLLAFTLAQNWNSAVALIIAAAIVKGVGSIDVPLILDGYRRGRESAWLPSQRWEVLLPLPIEQVRARLRVSAPPVYTPVRTSELRAGGML
jgi:ubiquinone biosynthesis protein COQ4